MKKYDWYWMTNPDWWEMKGLSPVLRPDAPREAQESYERYLLQVGDCNTAAVKTIGKIKEVYHDDSLSSIYDLISDEEPVDKGEILAYMKKAKVYASAPAILKDVISGERINKNLTMVSDGIFAWRSDTQYYFEKYNLKLDADFLKHVRSQKNSTFLMKEYKRICDKLGFIPSKYEPPFDGTENDNWENPFLKITHEENMFLYQNGFLLSEEPSTPTAQSEEEQNVD